MRFPDYLRQGKRGIPLPAQRRAWIRQPKVLLGVPQRLVERQHVYQKENPRHSLFERFPNVCPEPVLVKCLLVYCELHNDRPKTAETSAIRVN